MGKYAPCCGMPHLHNHPREKRRRIPMGIERYYCINRATSEGGKPHHTVAHCYTCAIDGPDLKTRHYTHCPCCGGVLA